MAKAKLVALAAKQAARAARAKGKTLVAVFTEKDKQIRKKKEKKDMMTSKNIVKEPPKEVAAPKAPLQDEPQQLPAQPPGKPPGESDYQRAYRMLQEARERLRGRGMPELDIEIDSFLQQINSWQHRQN